MLAWANRLFSVVGFCGVLLLKNTLIPSSAHFDIGGRERERERRALKWRVATTQPMGDWVQMLVR